MMYMNNETSEKYFSTSEEVIIDNPLQKIICVFKNGKEQEWDLENQNIKITLSIEFPFPSEIISINYMAQSEGFEPFFDSIPEKKIKLSCLFCGSEITYKYKLIQFSPITRCSKCCSLCYLSYEPNVMADLNLGLEEYKQLKNENKIRLYPLPQMENVYQTQIFPLTEKQLSVIFTDNQINAINKLINNERLTQSERVILSKNNKKIEKMMRKYYVLKKLFGDDVIG